MTDQKLEKVAALAITIEVDGGGITCSCGEAAGTQLDMLGLEDDKHESVLVVCEGGHSFTLYTGRADVNLYENEEDEEYEMEVEENDLPGVRREDDRLALPFGLPQLRNDLRLN